MSFTTGIDLGAPNCMTGQHSWAPWTWQDLGSTAGFDRGNDRWCGGGDRGQL